MNFHDVTYLPLPMLVFFGIALAFIVTCLVCVVRDMRTEENLTRLQRLGWFGLIALWAAFLVAVVLVMVGIGHDVKQHQADEKVQEARIARLAQASGVPRSALQDMPEHEGDQFTVRVRGAERTCVTTADYTELFCAGLERVIITK